MTGAVLKSACFVRNDGWEVGGAQWLKPSHPEEIAVVRLGMVATLRGLVGGVDYAAQTGVPVLLVGWWRQVR